MQESEAKTYEANMASNAKVELEMANMDQQNEMAEANDVKVDLKVMNQLQKEGEPNFLTALFVDRPICTLVGGFISLFVISAITFQLGYFDLTP